MAVDPLVQQSGISAVLLEAMRLSYDSYFDTADYLLSTPGALPSGNAVDRGWAPLSVEEVRLVDLFPAGLPLPPEFAVFEDLTSWMHVYRGEIEGVETLAIAFRGTDQGDLEFAFQGADLSGFGIEGLDYGWDVYFGAHAQSVGGIVSTLGTEVDQVLITGQSLGGIIAELTSARLLGEPTSPLAPFADKSLTVTYGSPGSTADAEGLPLLNVVHTDDFVAQLSALSPLFQAGGAAREGVDLAVERPEFTLPDLSPEQLSTPEGILAAAATPGIRLEHDPLLYLDTAEVLNAGESIVPNVANALVDDPLPWLLSETDLYEIGTSGDDIIAATTASRVIFGLEGDDFLQGHAQSDGLSGGAGKDLLRGQAGDDILDGGAQNDKLHGGTGNDKLDGGAGHDRIFGNKGHDKLFGDSGNDLLDGGHGHDYLAGNNGNDRLRGGHGDDELDGGNGNDRTHAGSGNDLIHASKGDDVIFGGRDIDTLRLDDMLENVTISADRGALLLAYDGGSSRIKGVEIIEFEAASINVEDLGTLTNRPIALSELVLSVDAIS